MKFGFEQSFLYDILCTLKITLNGQLDLIMLIEELALAGIQNISANTDGIVCIVPKDKEDVYYKICKAWEAKTELELEYTDYVKYARRDVNNYITIKRKKDGTLDIKRKGELNQYLNFEDLKKGYNMPIIAKAVEEYIVHGTPIRETIRAERNIYKFCSTQNINSKFTPVITSFDSTGECTNVHLQRAIRFYASTDNALIFKMDKGMVLEDDEILTKKKGISNLKVGTGVTVFNDYVHHDNFDDYHINYPFYIMAAERLAYGIVTGKTKKTAKHRKARQDIFHTGNLFEDSPVEKESSDN